MQEHAGRDGQVTAIPIGDILVVPDRMRRLRPDIVDEIAESIAQGPLLHPITLRRRASDGHLVLVAGQRLEAAHKRGWESIPAIVLGCRPRADPARRRSRRHRRHAPCRCGP